MALTKIFIEKCFECISTENYSLYIYGSASIDILNGRDIDAILISPDIEDACCISFELVGDKLKKMCNLYLVSDEVYINDVRYLKYGGYYSHKFALTFREILRNGNSLDAPLLYWLSEYNYYLKKHINKSEPNTFMKSVHLEIVKYRPTFARSLMNFIDNPSRIQNLHNYLHEILLFESLDDYNQTTLDFDSRSLSYKTAFFNFWTEYNRHKSTNSFWGKKTFLKIKWSLENINYNKLNRYLFESH